MAFDFKKEYKDLYLPKKKPSIIRVPKMNYLSVCGNGNPNEPDGDYHKSIELLYGIAYTLRMSYKTNHKIDGFYLILLPKKMLSGQKSRQDKRKRKIIRKLSFLPMMKDFVYNVFI